MLGSAAARQSVRAANPTATVLFHLTMVPPGRVFTHSRSILRSTALTNVNTVIGRKGAVTLSNISPVIAVSGTVCPGVFAC
jgi:hypothetical protein